MELNYISDDKRIIYIAGFFDGEGSVTIAKSSIGYYTLRLSISNTDEAPLIFTKAIFGGNIHKSASRNVLHKSVYVWYRNGYPAAEMLEKLLPYLIIKKERALLGMQIIGASKEHQLRIYNEMRELNKRGETPLK